MRAVVAARTGAADVLEPTDVEPPRRAPGQVVLEVRGSGVCYHDVLNRQGLFPRAKFPAILGHEIAGVVTESGPDVRGFEVGDRVATLQLQPCGACLQCSEGKESLCRSGPGFFGEETPGGYAEYVAAHTNALVHLPGEIGFETGSILACAIGTALHAIRARAQVQVGETVLVTGAGGGVGVHAVQLARLAGARVIAVTSSPEKADRLDELGAHDVVVSSDLDFARDVKALTDGQGVDAVLEIVGALTFPASLGSVRAGGRLVFVGNVSGEHVGVAPALTILKELTLMGSDACSRRELAVVMELVRRGAITPVLDRTVPLEQAADAHRLLEQRATSGRIVLVP